MSLAEVMQEIDTLSPEERLKVQAYLVHLRRKEDPAYRKELKERLDRVSAGDGVSDEQLRRNVKPLSGSAG